MKKIIKIDNEINVKEGGVIFSKEPDGLVSVVEYSQVIETGEYLVDIKRLYCVDDLKCFLSDVSAETMQEFLKGMELKTK